MSPQHNVGTTGKLPQLYPVTCFQTYAQADTLKGGKILKLKNKFVHLPTNNMHATKKGSERSKCPHQYTRTQNTYQDAKQKNIPLQMHKEFTKKRL